MNYPIMIAFIGPSDSGKTTLIVKLANLFQNNHKVAIIKHDPKNKAIFDKEGKDSHKFTKTGANVAVSSPKKTTFFLNEEKNIEEIAKTLLPFDILMIEGFKNCNLTKIGIFRNSVDESYFDICSALAVDKSVKESDVKKIPPHIDILNLNNEEMIANWILKNAQKRKV